MWILVFFVLFSPLNVVGTPACMTDCAVMTFAGASDPTIGSGQLCQVNGNTVSCFLLTVTCSGIPPTYPDTSVVLSVDLVGTGREGYSKAKRETCELN